VIGIVIRA